MYKLIFFDFFKNLTPNVYFSSFPIDVRKQISQLLFKPPNNELWEIPWMSGRKKSDQVFEYLSCNINYSKEDIKAIRIKGLEKIEWNSQVWHFSQKIRKEVKTAIVTINSDLFHQKIVPYFQLGSYFDAVISSAEIGITDKVVLCKMAAQELIDSQEINQSLLIDDNRENTESFMAFGRHSILYQGEESFHKQIIKNAYLSVFAGN